MKWTKLVKANENLRVKEELQEILNKINNEQDLFMSEIVYLQEHKEDIKRLFPNEPQLWQWADISEEEWNNHQASKQVKAYHTFTNNYNAESLNQIQEDIGNALDEVSKFNNSIKYEDKWSSLSNQDKEKLIKAGEYLYKMLWKSRNVLKDIDTLFNGSDTPEGSIERSTLPFELKRYK